MQCHEFDERLQTLLDDRQAPERDGQLQAHASRCLNCREVLDLQQSLFRSLRTSALTPPVGFPSRVLQRAEIAGAATRRQTVVRRWVAAATILSTAAAVLIVVTITMNGAPRPAGAPIAGPRKPSSDPVQKPAGVVAADDTRGLNQRPGRELPGHKRRVMAAAGSATSANDVQSMGQYGQVLQSLASRVPEAVERLDEVEAATPGLRPVRTSFTLAIGTIRRTIPPRPKRAPPRPAKRDSGLLASASLPWV